MCARASKNSANVYCQGVHKTSHGLEDREVRDFEGHSSSQFQMENSNNRRWEKTRFLTNCWNGSKVERKRRIGCMSMTTKINTAELKCCAVEPARLRPLTL